MKQLFHILKYKVYLFFVLNVSLTPQSVIKNLATGLVYFGFAAGIYKVAYAALSYMSGPLHLNIFLIHRLIAIVLFIFFLTVNAGNILVSLTGLFRSSEINFLLTKPVAFEDIFLVKFFDNFFYSSATLFMILFAVLFAYGNFFGLGISFYAVALFGLFLPLMLIAGLLGVLLLFGMLAAAKKIGLKTTVFVLVLLYVSSTVLFFVGNDPPQVLERAIASESYAMSIFSSLDSPFLKILPNYWVANGMYWFVKGEYGRTFTYAALLFSVAGVFTGLNYLIARKYFYSAYQTAQNVRFRTGEPSRGKSGVVIDFFSPWKRFPSVRALLRREAALFLRDVSQVLQLSFMILLIVLFVSSISYRPQMIFRTLNPQLQTVIYLIFFLFNSFMITSVALRFVFPLQSLEGEVYWRIRSAPVNFRALMYWRASGYMSLVLILAEALNLFSHRHFSGSLLLFSSVLTFFLTLTITAIHYSLGVYFADYKEKNPIRIASSQGASTAFLISLFYLGLVIGLLFPVLLRYFLSTQNLRTAFPFENFYPVASLVITVSMIITGLSIMLVRRCAARDVL